VDYDSAIKLIRKLILSIENSEIKNTLADYQHNVISD